MTRNLILLCRRHHVHWHLGKIFLTDLHIPWHDSQHHGNRVTAGTAPPRE